MSPEPRGGLARVTARCVSVATAFVLVGTLAACGPADSGLKKDTARQFQERVLAVTQAAAGNDPAAALSALDGLEADVAAAADRGDVSEDRRRSITTATAAVRADLTQALAAAVAAAATAKAKAAEEAAAQKQAEADAAAEAAASNPAPVAPAPVPAPAPAEEGGENDNKGKGKGKGD